jgi:hypothetical protein
MTENWSNYVKRVRKDFKDEGIILSYGQAMVMAKETYQKGVPQEQIPTPNPQTATVPEHPRKAAAARNKEANKTYDQNVSDQRDKRKNDGRKKKLSYSKPQYSSDSEEDVKPRRRKKKVVYVDESSDDEEVVVVKRKPKKAPVKERKVKYVYE